MTGIAKHLADTIDIRFSERALFLDYKDQKWSVQTEQENIYTADGLIITAPVPQSLLLIKTGKNEVNSDDINELSAITYEPCLGFLMTSDENSFIDPPGAYQLSGEPISWICDNRVKGISADPAPIGLAGDAFGGPRVEGAALSGIAAAEKILNHI
jgi:predicted NAD/FAD-dependent oxidoreductase